MKINEALTFRSLYFRLKDEPLNIKLAYKLNKLNLRTLSEVEFYETSLQKILKECAQIDENGNLKATEDGTGILIKPEYLEECHSKINELESIEFEADIKFTLDELEELKITPAELSCLINLIED